MSVAAPTALLATVDTSPGAASPSVLLSWVDNSDNETSFKIERKTGTGGTYAQIGNAGANATGYSDTSADRWHELLLPRSGR